MKAPVGVLNFYYNGLQRETLKQTKKRPMTSFNDKFAVFGRKNGPSESETSVSSFYPKLFMNRNLATQLIFAVGFSVASLFVAHFSTIGFQVVITSIAYILFALGAVFVVNKQQDAVSVGVCIGSGAVISLLSLVTTVYWGELTHCTVTTETIKEYSCENKPAMKALCGFAAVLFVLQASFTYILNNYKTHVLAESQQYTEVPQGALESDDLDTEPLYAAKSWSADTREPRPGDTVIV